MNKYTAVNFKSPILYFYLLMLLALSALVILITIKENNFWINELSFVFFLIVLVSLIYVVNGKVIVDYTIITKKSIFGTRSIKIEDIKSFGVMKQEGTLGIRIMGESEFNTPDWIFPKTIFVSTRKDYNPLSYKKKETIKFHYRENLYMDILEKIKACKYHVQ